MIMKLLVYILRFHVINFKHKERKFHAFLLRMRKDWEFGGKGISIAL